MMAERFTTDELISSLNAFLEWGEQEEGKSQQGYFSGDGFAARCLRAHLADISKCATQPSCDGKGGHKDSPFVNPDLEHSTTGWTEQPEPSLQLLVIDLGDSCVVKVEKNTSGIQWLEIGTKRIGLGDGLEKRTLPEISAKVIHVLFEPFTAVREAIDSQDKPVPRIIEQGGGDIGAKYRLCYAGDGNLPITESAHNALSELAGKPLPIYTPTEGTWTLLKGSEIPGIAMYRYTR